MAPFIDPRRLTRRAEKLPGEQVRQRRVIVPVGDQAPQQVGTPEERAVCRRRAAQDDVIAAAGPGVASVEHELLGREAHLPRIFIERGGPVDELIPVAGRLHVHLDHSRIRGDEKMWQPGIVWRRIALEQHAQAEGARRGFDGGNQIQVVLDRLQRRHEDVQDCRREAGRTTRNGRRRRPIRLETAGAGAVVDRLWIATPGRDCAAGLSTP